VIVSAPVPTVTVPIAIAMARATVIAGTAVVAGGHTAVILTAVSSRCAQRILDFHTVGARIRDALPVGGSVIVSRPGLMPAPRVLVIRTARAIRHDLPTFALSSRTDASDDAADACGNGEDEMEPRQVGADRGRDVGVQLPRPAVPRDRPGCGRSPPRW
jgi:hypothetical protein